MSVLKPNLAMVELLISVCYSRRDFGLEGTHPGFLSTIMKLIPSFSVYFFLQSCDLSVEKLLSEGDPRSSRLHLSSASLTFGEFGSIDRCLSPLGKERRS